MKKIKMTEQQFSNIIKRTIDEEGDFPMEINELDLESYKNSEAFAPLRDALKKNQTVSVVFVKKDGTVRPMAIRRSLKSHVFSDRVRTDAQRNIPQNFDLKRFIDINVYIKALRDLGDKEAAAKLAWRSVPLQDTLGFLAGGRFYDVREENDILNRFGEEVYNSLTKSMVRAVEAQQADAEANLEQEEGEENLPNQPEQPINENKTAKNMRRIVRLSNTDLNKMIKRVLKEQEDQYGTTGPAPEEITGVAPEEEGGEPNYEAFLSAANELLGQGLTIGDLVDKLCENKETEPETTEPEPDQSIPSDNQ